MKTTLAPWLSVRNGAEAVAFYQSAFGAVEVFHLEGDGESIVSRLSIQGAEFWLSDEAPEYGNFSPQTLGGATSRFVLTVADPQAMFNRAVAAGGASVHPVREEQGWLVGRIADLFGHHWEIGRPLE